MRIVFWGTPQAAVPFLDGLAARHDLAGVVTRADKPARRGQELRKSPVKAWAESRGVPVLQPERVKDGEFLARLNALRPEAGIVVAYGKILPKAVIESFPKGIYNVHFSLLPLLRGASPVQHALLEGLEATGVSVFRIEESLDTGRIFSQRRIAVDAEDDALTLESKLVPLGVQALDETLEKIERGEAGDPQEGPSTCAPLLKKEDARLSWDQPAVAVERRVRALVRPGAFALLPDGKPLKILQAKAAEDGAQSEGRAPGSIVSIERNQGFVVKCKKGGLLVRRVQAEGKKATDAWSFLQGHRLKPGDHFGF